MCDKCGKNPDGIIPCPDCGHKGIYENDPLICRGCLKESYVTPCPHCGFRGASPKSSLEADLARDAENKF